MFKTNCGAKRWSAPNTAKETAIHKFVSATIVSRPWASAISSFAANSPTRKAAIPAEHIATAMREIAMKVPKMIGCIASGLCEFQILIRELLKLVPYVDAFLHQ